MGEQSGDKTEEPTPHKLREARKKGQVTKSKEVTTAFLILITYYIFKVNAEKIWFAIVEYGDSVFRGIPQVQTQFNVQYATQILYQGIRVFFRALSPILITIFFATILLEGLQTQFSFSGESIKPKLEKLDPISGVKRMFSVKGLVQIVLSIVKIIIVAYLTWSVIKNYLPQILSSMNMEPWHVMLLTAKLVFSVAMKVAGFYIVIALIDYFYQKSAFKKSMMMTKQEVKEEYKRLEGDPTIKQRQRQVQREMAQQRQMGKVPEADVVVTNPTHIAIAILYDAKLMKAPQVVAKGKRLTAMKIRELAIEHNVPIVENKPLARELYDQAQVGSVIPPLLYRAVAEVLAFVYRLGRNKQKLTHPVNQTQTNPNDAREVSPATINNPDVILENRPPITVVNPEIEEIHN